MLRFMSVTLMVSEEGTRVSEVDMRVFLKSKCEHCSRKLLMTIFRLYCVKIKHNSKK